MCILYVYNVQAIITAHINCFYIFVISNEATGWTPLTWASSQGHVKVVKYLLEKGADVDGKFCPNKLKSGKDKTSWNVSLVSRFMYSTAVYACRAKALVLCVAHSIKY